MDKISVIFAGTGDVAVPVLEALICDPRINVLMIVTGKDKPKGRGLETSFSAIKQIGIKNKIIVQQPSKIAELNQDFIHIKPDFLLIVAYGEIIPKSTIDIAKFASVNPHVSLLPKYRGASPVQSALLQEETETGVSWIKITEKMDAGDIIHQEKTAIDVNDSYGTLSDKLFKLAGEKTADVLINYTKNPRGVVQDDSRATFCKKISKEDGVIDLKTHSVRQIMAKIRAYTPWPGCTLFWNGKRLKLLKAHPVEQKIDTAEVVIIKDQFLIGATDGTISIDELQPESKRAMSAKDFIRGQQIA